jgi:hypothetical protein
MTSLVDQIVAIHHALDESEVPHAFGGALALAWCTQRARATTDINLNLFVGVDAAETALTALPPGITVSDSDREAIAADGQTRLWWDHTPVDVFFSTTAFHADVAMRARTEQFGGTTVPFLACRDLAVFKAFFNRTKDWADLEEMASAGTPDRAVVLGELVVLLGGHDERIERLRSL